MSEKAIPFPGFAVGVNYWASHAGTRMWSDFSAEEVEADFAALQKAGVDTLRIFPLWPDFQPIAALRGCGGVFRELVFTDGAPLPHAGSRSCGLDPLMMERFRTVADLAQKYGFKLIVGLLTGWMSGALFLPPAIAGLNLVEDPLALRVAEMFLRGFVNEMKDHPAIVAWEPGNECNCLARSDADHTWNWLHAVTSAIRLADPSRPVFSGMHNARCGRLDPWNLIDVGSLCDVLTTHPYPAFTRHCGKSALNTVPAIYHSTAETLFYRGVAGRPAVIEEIGSFGSGYLSAERTEAFCYTSLWSALVHGLGAMLWWCGFSFDRCADAVPYRRGTMERDLGAFRSDRSTGGAARAMRRFADERRSLPEIPPREIDAVVVLTALPDAWQTAFGAFILAKQAGFEIEYCALDAVDEVPESKFYLVPCISGYEVMEIGKYRQLLAAAQQGATVVFTADSGFLQPFDEFFGCSVDYRTQEPETLRFTLAGKCFAVETKITRRMVKGDCDVIAAAEDGSPVITMKAYGAGKLVFVNAPLENNAQTAGNELHLVYRKLAELADVEVPEKSPAVGVTRHRLPDGRVLKFFINYSDIPADGIPGNGIRHEITDAESE